MRDDQEESSAREELERGEIMDQHDSPEGSGDPARKGGLQDLVADSQQSEDETEEGEDVTTEITELSQALELADDPVRMYLKEIGRVDLLEADQELWLSVRMSADDQLGQLRSNRPRGASSSEGLVAAHSTNLDNLFVNWKRLGKEINRMNQPEPDLRLIIEEGRQLRITWQADSPSYLRAWLDNGLWGTEPDWEEVARGAINLFTALYLTPPEVQQRLSRRFADGKGLPTKRTLKRWLPDAERLAEDSKIIAKLADESQSALIRANLRLVVSVAKRYMGRGIAFLDLIQEGNIGLMKAVDKFDHRKGCRFRTYATYWIQHAMTRAIAKQANPIRIPVRIINTLRKVHRAEDQYIKQHGRPPSSKQLAEHLDIPIEEIEKVKEIPRHVTSLEGSVSDQDDDGDMLIKLIEDVNTPSPMKEAFRELVRDELNDVLGVLSDREQQVLQLRYGLRDGHARTLEQIGAALNISRERVRQIEAGALDKLKQPELKQRLKRFKQLM